MSPVHTTPKWFNYSLGNRIVCSKRGGSFHGQVNVRTGPEMSSEHVAKLGNLALISAARPTADPDFPKSWIIFSPIRFCVQFLLPQIQYEWVRAMCRTTWQPMKWKREKTDIDGCMLSDYTQEKKNERNARRVSAALFPYEFNSIYLNVFWKRLPIIESNKNKFLYESFVWPNTSA